MSHLSRAFPSLLIALCLCSVNRTLAATNTVTTTGDTGAGSLRQTVANAATNDVIDFSVTGTITLTSGEILIDKDLTISGPGADVLAVSGNSASRIFNITNNVAVSVSGLTFKDGTDATGAGGGIHNAGTLTLVACTISNCQAGGPFLSGGGAIFNATSSVLIVVNSTLDHNQAAGGAGDESGGGIYNAGGSATISNSTVAANVAQGTNGFGGGIFNLSGSNVVISSTIALNSAAGVGGGIVNSNGVFTVTDSIIATNMGMGTATNAPDAVGDFISGGSNLIGDGDGATASGGGADLVGSAAALLDPLLGPLQNNGGTTFTLELLPGSPAINAGSCASTNGTDFDQRGLPRPVGPACDIGPFEVQACTNLGSTITCISTNLVGVPIDPAGGRVFFDTPTFTSSCPGANVQTTPPSGGLFPIGTNAIPALLLDASGTELTNCTFTVIIRGIDEELDDAIALTTSPDLGLSAKLQKVILRKLNAAKKTLLAGRRGQTCRTLQKLTSRVDKEVVHGFITPTQANQLFPPISGVEGAIACR